MFQVRLATCSDDVYNNKSMVADILKIFSPYEVVSLLNGEKVPYTYDEQGNIIEYVFINEPNIESIKQSFIKFEQREVTK